MSQYVFKLPDVGEGTAEAEISAWHVAVGDTIQEDDPLVDIMTDKATVEIPSPVTGRVIALHGEPGQMVPVGSEIVVLELSKEGANETPTKDILGSTAPLNRVQKPLTARNETSFLPIDEVSRDTKSAFVAATNRILTSPAVRRRAWDRGIALQFVKGSGPNGRITHEDLDSYLASSVESQPVHAFTRKPGISEAKVVGLRRKIAERMLLSKQRIPHYSYVEEVDLTALESLRQHLNGTATAAQPKLTLLPFLIRAITLALLEYPQINSIYDDEANVLRSFDALHAGIATQTPTGLMVPVLRHAESLGLWEMAAAILDLAGKARTNRCSRGELTGSTITITSLGTLGGMMTTPVINHPEVAIVGVNKIAERPVVLDGAIVVRKMMNLSSSFDHRIVDGTDAASFIQRLKQLLEQPGTLFLGAER